MGTPSRTSLLLDIKTKLEAITVANGYHTTVVTVAPYFDSRDTIPIDERPYLGFGITRDEATTDPCGRIYMRAQLYVIGIVTDAAWGTRADKIQKLIDDVIAALLSDQTRGGNAISTELVAVETDEADPDAGADGGFCVCEFAVTYDRTTGST